MPSLPMFVAVSMAVGIGTSFAASLLAGTGTDAGKVGGLVVALAAPVLTYYALRAVR